MRTTFKLGNLNLENQLVVENAEVTLEMTPAEYMEVVRMYPDILRKVTEFVKSIK